MKERNVSILSLLAVLALGIAGLATANYGGSVSSKFLLALFPLLVVLAGVALLRQSGLTMAIVGLVITLLLAVLEFGTPVEVASGAALYGFLSSFGISVSVAATMLMIFLMKETGLLGTVSRVIKKQVVGNEVQALFIGIGFGSFLTCLGVVTPALFPPLLITMGFSPTAAIAIAVLGYDPTTSFSLLSIPITLPAQIGGFNPIEFAFKIALFLPLVSTGFSFAILWLIGGKRSVRKGIAPALICGLALAFACLGAVSLDYVTGVEYIPLRIVGVVAGLCAMASLLAYQKLRGRPVVEKDSSYPTRREVFRAFSPWIILTVLAAIVSVPQVGSWLSDLPGNLERVTVFADRSIDFNVLSQIYTWILASVLISMLTIKPDRKQMKSALNLWIRRFIGPFLTYCLYFSISFTMAYSAMNIVGGALNPSAEYGQLNMNAILGKTLASCFGAGYVFVAASLGLFGAIVGGSETSSNVLFLKIQQIASNDVGLDNTGFMTVYGSHAVAGGIASAVTPAKISNAVATIDGGKNIEFLIMRKHLVIALLLTVVTGVLTGFLVNLGI